MSTSTGPDRFDQGRSTLALLQLADSALPVGRFVHSLGMEAWLAAHADADADDIACLIASAVAEGAAPLDGAAVAHAHRAACLERLCEVDRSVSVRKMIDGNREASQACGRQLARLGPQLLDGPLVTALDGAVRDRVTDGNVAVVHGALCRAAGVSALDAVIVELRGTATALLSVGVRLGRLTPQHAQRLQAELWATIAESAAGALEIELDRMSSNTFELDVYALVHPRTEIRFFKT